MSANIFGCHTEVVLLAFSRYRYRQGCCYSSYNAQENSAQRGIIHLKMPILPMLRATKLWNVIHYDMYLECLKSILGR